MTEPPHRLLPPDAIAILQRAAKSETGTPMQRRKAMEEAEKRVKRMYPQFFRE